MSKPFETKDFYLAAYLKASGFVLSGVDKSNPQSALFSFDFNPEINAAVDLFLFGKATTYTKDFIVALKEIKQLIYARY